MMHAKMVAALKTCGGRGWTALAIAAGLAYGSAARADVASGEPLASVEWKVDAASLSMNVGDEIEVPLPGAGRAKVMVVSIDLRGAGHTTVTGVIAGESGSSVVLARRGEVLQGRVFSPARGAFEVRLHVEAPGAGIRQVVSREDPNAGGCATAQEHEVHATNGEMIRGDRGAGALSRVSVLFLYTEAARTGRGGQAAMDALIDSVIVQANSAYAASDANIRIYEATRALVNYAETSNSSTDLSALRSTTDGILDEAHCLRNAYGADFVSLITNSASSGVCGIGYVMTNVSTGFSPSAFNVTRASCVSGFTLVHELGHNMGCTHDRANAGSASHPFAYGFRTSDNVYRTIMAYSPGTRIGRFSNPDTVFNGYAMGVPMSDPNATNNALALTLNGPTISAFRADTALFIGDFNGDGAATPQDVFDFLGAWFAGALSADANASGGVSVEDLFFFLNMWFSATPANC